MATSEIKIPTLSSLLGVFKFFRYIWKPFFVSVFLQVFLSYTILYSIEALNIAISQVDPSREIDKNSWLYQWFAEPASGADQIIINCILFALAIIFVGMICDIVIAWTISWSLALLNKSLTPKVIRQLVYSETADIVKKQEATIVQRWLTIKQIADFFHNVLANSLGSVFTLGVLLWGTYRENVIAGHSLVVILLIWLILLLIFSPKALSTAREYAQMEENVGRNIRSSVSLSESLKLKEIFDRFFEKIRPNINLYSRSISLQGFYGSLLYGVLSGVASLAPLAVIIVTIISNSDHSVGIATAAILYLFVSKITSPLASLARITPILQSQRVDFVRFQSLYKADPGAEKTEDVKVIQGSKHLRIDEFKYKYADSKELLFKEVSFERGKITGISGRSGSGKTTLLKIISGRLDNKVNVSIGLDISIPLIDLMHEIAYLPQEPKLAEMSVKDNLHLYTANGALVNPHSKILYEQITANLPQNEDTIITSDVIGLSVGQRRALSVINSLSLKKPVIILDEPLAHIDREWADLIWQAIEAEKESKWVIVALHDETYKARCDNIVELN